MDKKTIAKVLGSVAKALKKHSPELMTGIGIAGMIAATVTAVKATPKAIQLVDEKEIQDGKRLSTAEIVKTTWKCYVPAAVTGVCAISCVIGASAINARRNAALATAYAISMTDLNAYKKKALEVVGEKKEQAIRDAVAAEQLEKAHVETRQIIFTGRGETPCYDPLTDRYFKSDMETLRKAENTLNKRMCSEMTITLNEFYTEIGLDECQLGERLGWDIARGYIELSFSSHLDVNGVPCIVLGHANPPQYFDYI